MMLSIRPLHNVVTMLYETARHEPLHVIDWDETCVRETIAYIVRDTEARFTAEAYWPEHPRDNACEAGPSLPTSPLYHGACGVLWALNYLNAIGAVQLQTHYAEHLQTLLSRNRAWLAAGDSSDFASYLMGDTPILMLAYGHDASEQLADRLAALIETNLEHPARELMWGSPGTLLAALFLHQRTGQARWANLFRDTAQQLWSQLQWSPEYRCHYWTQDLYGEQSTYLGGVHGFVATASPLIRGRHLLNADSWAAWQHCIVNTIERTANRQGEQANWSAKLYVPEGKTPRMLMQFCHGAPGFVICLAGMPGTELDSLLLTAGESIWAAGPLVKGSNLCHGTGGNGYAFLALYQRTGDLKWLNRARAFAMHGIEQSQADERRYGQLRYSLWTGDPGFAVFLWDCLRGRAEFPTLDIFYGDAPALTA